MLGSIAPLLRCLLFIREAIRRQMIPSQHTTSTRTNQFFECCQFTAGHREGFLGRIGRQVMVRQAAIRNPHRHPVMPVVKFAKAVDVTVASRFHQFRVLTTGLPKQLGSA